MIVYLADHWNHDKLIKLVKACYKSTELFESIWVVIDGRPPFDYMIPLDIVTTWVFWRVDTLLIKMGERMRIRKLFATNSLYFHLLLLSSKCKATLAGATCACELLVDPFFLSDNENEAIDQSLRLQPNLLQYPSR